MPNNVDINYSVDYHSKDNIYKSKSLANNYYRRLNKKIESNKYCLEIGGSFGFFSKILQDKKQCLVRNIEPSIYASNYANKNSVKTFNNIDELDIKLFDYIFSFHVIEHIKADDIKNFITETMKLLNPDGIFYIFTPNANAVSLKLFGKHYSWLAPDEHLSFLTDLSFNYLLDKNAISFSTKEEIPAFAHYPMPSFISFVRKKIFKHKVSDFIKTTEDIKVKLSLKQKIIYTLKNIFRFSVYFERVFLYPIYRFYNIFSSHHDELVIECKKIGD
jgi:SAM-dependent methyltransferase